MKSALLISSSCRWRTEPTYKVRPYPISSHMVHASRHPGQIFDIAYVFFHGLAPASRLHNLSFPCFRVAIAGSAESTFPGFTQAYAQAGPQAFPLAQINSTFASISLDIQELIDVRPSHPSPSSKLTNTGLCLTAWQMAYDLRKTGDPNFDLTAAQIRGKYV
jgi:hypothetical protein